MSTTRHAIPGKPLQQRRFASSPDIERGLLANLVAIKTASLPADEAAFVWTIHRFSHRPGGLHALANELLARSSPPSPPSPPTARDDSPELDDTPCSKEEALLRRAIEASQRLAVSRRK